MASITVDFEGHRVQLPAGAKITELTGRRSHPRGMPVAALLNQRLVSLERPLIDGAVVQVVTRDDPEGLRIVRRSTCLLLYEAFRRIAPQARVVSGQTLGPWYYFDVVGTDEAVPELVARAREQMERLRAEDLRFEVQRLNTDEAVERFAKEGRHDRMALLRTWWHESVRVVNAGGYLDIRHGPVVPSAAYLPPFALHPYAQGFVLGFAAGGPSAADIAQPPPLMKGLLGIYQETKAWNRVLGVANVGDLNRVCTTNEYRHLISVAEGFHEKKIATIADRIAGCGGRTRLILVAGPSSSGKTTFTKRLAVQLQVAGLHPVALSVDDYYIDRERTPLGEDGKPDFEALEAVDLELFNEHLRRLLAGEEVRTPRYDFISGRRVDPEKWRAMKLADCDVLIVEGIHGLNERLSAAVPAEAKFRIYVSALTQLSLDDQNRLSTADARLLRRLVRDRIYRGHTAATTIATWPNVRRGEEKHIFPFQESADAMMNTALVYETAVLKVYAQRFLLEVPTDHPSFAEAYRLLKFLELFVPVFPDRVPQNSILREFIGGSIFQY
ncbi:MAG: nucleoside kinase [Deltaproteobacteria bacterium]|nr:nucleoside kinase [Deltaproteobacteria bacterium]